MVIEKFWENLKHWRRQGVVSLILLIVCFGTYSNSLHNGFMVDDYVLLIDDTKLHNIKFILYQFLPDLNKTLGIDAGTSAVYYRPFAHILPGLCYLAFGKNPFGYHVVNLILFYMSCVMVYVFLNLLLKEWRVAFLTSLFFCVHPLNGVMVNYITADVFCLQIFSMLLSLILFLMAQERTKVLMLYFFSVFWFGISLLCHETAMALPFYLAACLFLIKKYNVKKIVRLCTPYFLILLVYLLFRFYHASLKVSILDKISQFHISFFNYIATFTKLIVWYVSKFFFCDGIVLIWAIPVIRDNLFLWNLLFWGLILFWSFIIFVYWKKDGRSFALVWLALGFLPVSLACLFQPTAGFMMEPHWLIFSSIGMFLLIAWVFLAFQKKIRKRLRSFLIIVFLLALMTVNRSYNNLWGDEEKYCRYWLKNAPGFKSVMFYLGSVYMKKGRYEEARAIYRRALENKYGDFEIYNNLGLMDGIQENFDFAIDHFKKALQYNPHSAVVYNNLGTVLLKLGDLPGAEEDFRRADDLNPFLIEPRLNLTEIDKRNKEYNEATVLLEKNLEIDPMDEPSMFLLAELSLVNGHKDRALELTKNLLRKSKDPQRLVNLGGCFAQARFSNMAFALYSRALEIDPCNKEAHIGMGKVFGNRDQFHQAIVMWQEGLTCHPQEKVFEDLISEARELLREKQMMK